MKDKFKSITALRKNQAYLATSRKVVAKQIRYKGQVYRLKLAAKDAKSGVWQRCNALEARAKNVADHLHEAGKSTTMGMASVRGHLQHAEGEAKSLLEGISNLLISDQLFHIPGTRPVKGLR